MEPGKGRNHSRRRRSLHCETSAGQRGRTPPLDLRQVRTRSTCSSEQIGARENSTHELSSSRSSSSTTFTSRYLESESSASSLERGPSERTAEEMVRVEKPIEALPPFSVGRDASLSAGGGRVLQNVRQDGSERRLSIDDISEREKREPQSSLVGVDSERGKGKRGSNVVPKGDYTQRFFFLLCPPFSLQREDSDIVCCILKIILPDFVINFLST